MLAIAVALAMDALAVSVATGVCLHVVNFRQVFRLAFHFGLFQALMPIIGWLGGLTVRDFIDAYAHWVAFGLLLFVSANMIREAWQHADDDAPRKDPTKGFSLVMLSVATSIDALAVGFSMSVLNVSIWVPALVIGLVAGIFTVTGLQLGCRIGSIKKFARYAELAGAMVLLAIGINILYEHGVFS
jgi:manganese efflux pump family protein